MATLKDVAKLASVDVSTVSRALNGTSYVHPETRVRILTAVKELSYQPNLMAKGLRQGKRHNIGVLIPSLSLTIFGEITQVIETEARKLGYGVMICNTEDDGVIEKECLLRLRNGFVDGIIIAPTGHNMKLLQEIKDSGIPVAQIVRNLDQTISSVAANYFSCGYDGVKYLISKGCMHIGLVNGSMDIIPYRERYQGYHKALQEHGYSESVAKTFMTHSNSFLEGYKGTNYLLDQNKYMDGLIVAADMIGTAATGGAYYPIGISMAQIITDTLGIDTTAQVTGGAAENNTLIDAGTVDIAITQSSLAFAAVNGNAPYDKKMPSVQAVMTGLSKGIFHVVTLKSTGIQSLADLKGKTVVLGPAGGAAITMANEVFTQYGFSIDDLTASYISYSDGMAALKDGTADAVVVQSAAPASAIQELAATDADNMVLFSIDADIIQKLVETYPYYSFIDIPADVYGTETEIYTIYVSNMIVCSADLSEDLVYNMTKALFENLVKLKEANPAAKGLTLEGATIGCPIDIHPGALAYYKEVGVIE